MNKRLFPLVQAAMIAAALIGGNAASIVSAEDAPVIPQETALTETAEPAATETVTTEPESAPDEPSETPEEPEAPAEPEIVEFAAEPEEAALEALMSAPESETIEPEIVQAAAETLSAMPTARKAAALKAMRPVTYVPEGLPEGVTLSVDVPPAAFSEPVEIYARFLTDAEDGSFSEDIIAAAEALYEEAQAACEEGYSAGVMLFDLSFVNEAGEEVEPALPVSVSMAYSAGGDMTETEVTNIRHYTDTEDVTVFEDLDYSSASTEDSAEVKYITESCSQFTITWVHSGWTIHGEDGTLTIKTVDENGTAIGSNSNTISELNEGNIYSITHPSINEYTYCGSYFSTPFPASSSDLINDCNFIRLRFERSFIFGIFYRVPDYWQYGTIRDKVDDHTIDYTGDLTLYLVYYRDPYPVTLHYGTTLNPNVTSLDDCFLANETDTVQVSSTNSFILNSHAYANKNLGDLTIYKKTASGLVKVPDSELTLTNGYKNHPADDYYFIYYSIPAPTGVTQKAAPYAAMVILAAVSAAVMIKRRKGGDVDETSPL